MSQEAETAFKDLLWLAGAKVQPDAAIDPTRINWQRLIQLAYEQRMLPLMHDKIVGYLKNLPGYEEHIRLLRKAHLAVTRRNLALAAETLRLLEALKKGGVQALAFKGCVLSVTVYNNLSARKDGDIDLLVRQRDVWKALEVLADCGYQPYRKRSRAEALGHLKYDCEWELFNAGKLMGVDLHWEFSARNSGLPVPRFLERIWSHPQEVSVCGCSILTLGVEDLIFMLCLHAAKHHWQRLEWIHTLAHLINRSPRIDWDGLFRVADSCMAERTLALGLSICSMVYEVDLPTEMRRRVQADQPAGQLAKRALDWLVHGKSDALVTAALRKFNVAARAGLSAKIYYLLCAAATPSAKDYCVELPPWLSKGYYVIRAGRLLAGSIARLFAKPPASMPSEAVQWIPKPEVLGIGGTKSFNRQ